MHPTLQSLRAAKDLRICERACIVEGTSASYDTAPNNALHANTPFYTRRPWYWSSCTPPKAGIGLQWPNQQERTRPNVKFRLGPAIRTDMPPHSIAIYPCLCSQPPVEHQPQRYSGSPPAAHRQVQDQGGCQPEPDVSHYCRAGIRNTVTSTTPGGPRHPHNADRHPRDMHAICMLSQIV